MTPGERVYHPPVKIAAGTPVTALHRLAANKNRSGVAAGTHHRRLDSPWRLSACPDQPPLCRRDSLSPGLAAEEASAPVYSHPRPWGVSAICCWSTVNLGPVKALCLGVLNRNKIPVWNCWFWILVTVIFQSYLSNSKISIGREGGREGSCSESASPGGVEFRRLQVKVAERCRVHAALIPGGWAAAPSLCWVLDGDSKGWRDGFQQHLVQVVSRRCQSRQRQERSRVDPTSSKSRAQSARHGGVETQMHCHSTAPPLCLGEPCWFTIGRHCVAIS